MVVVYVVVKKGVYRHELFGVYAHLAEANLAAERMLQREPDDYHTAEIVEMEMNTDAKPSDIMPGRWTEKIVGERSR